MNFITFAEKLGIDREAAIKVYRLFNGGYFESLYYSKPPILHKLREWPRKYLSKKLVLIRNIQLNQAFEALIWGDIIAIYGMSSTLINKPIKYDILEKNVEYVYEEIKKFSLSNNFTDYPTALSLDFVKVDFSPFVNDLTSKRKEEIEASDSEIINDIAYDSKLMEEIKVRYPWAKNVKRENAIRAFQLSERVNEFVDYVIPFIYYLAASKTLHFDYTLISNTISDTVKIVEEEGSKAIKEQEVSSEYQRKVKELFQLIITTLNYF
ncbi:hypothetical protein GFS03_01515 [Sulfolobus sp. E5-1-F]|uniref:hypothetical protein n=1 Tax=Sulfolobaceae TaxID=118883 RepID=UPI00129583FC|nr:MULTISPECIES: hypothetical protein [unclassified Sulfolobus]QGA53352.1 hypothetical protein GFS03_01515 [Sulfolobus sp. E5-1-F]QGA68459.1 hypothetical protein GFS33_06715 [Sulfolobus sp. E11-6]